MKAFIFSILVLLFFITSCNKNDVIKMCIRDSLDPVEHVGIDPVLARDTRLGFRPDERQMIDNTGNCHGNIYCSVVGEGRRTGGDNVG